MYNYAPTPSSMQTPPPALYAWPSASPRVVGAIDELHSTARELRVLARILRVPLQRSHTHASDVTVLAASPTHSLYQSEQSLRSSPLTTPAAAGSMASSSSAATAAASSLNATATPAFASPRQQTTYVPSDTAAHWAAPAATAERTRAIAHDHTPASPLRPVSSEQLKADQLDRVIADLEQWNARTSAEMRTAAGRHSQTKLALLAGSATPNGHRDDHTTAAFPTHSITIPPPPASAQRDTHSRSGINLHEAEYSQYQSAQQHQQQLHQHQFSEGSPTPSPVPVEGSFMPVSPSQRPALFTSSFLASPSPTRDRPFTPSATTTWSPSPSPSPSGVPPTHRSPPHSHVVSARVSIPSSSSYYYSRATARPSPYRETLSPERHASSVGVNEQQQQQQPSWDEVAPENNHRWAPAAPPHVPVDEPAMWQHMDGAHPPSSSPDEVAAAAADVAAVASMVVAVEVLSRRVPVVRDGRPRTAAPRVEVMLHVSGELVGVASAQMAGAAASASASSYDRAELDALVAVLQGAGMLDPSAGDASGLHSRATIAAAMASVPSPHAALSRHIDANELSTPVQFGALHRAQLVPPLDVYMQRAYTAQQVAQGQIASTDMPPREAMQEYLWRRRSCDAAQHGPGQWLDEDTEEPAMHAQETSSIGQQLLQQFIAQRAHSQQQAREAASIRATPASSTARPDSVKKSSHHRSASLSRHAAPSSVPRSRAFANPREARRFLEQQEREAAAAKAAAEATRRHHQSGSAAGTTTTQWKQYRWKMHPPPVVRDDRETESQHSEQQYQGQQYQEQQQYQESQYQQHFDSPSPSPLHQTSASFATTLPRTSMSEQQRHHLTGAYQSDSSDPTTSCVSPLHLSDRSTPVDEWARQQVTPTPHTYDAVQDGRGAHMAYAANDLTSPMSAARLTTLQSSAARSRDTHQWARDTLRRIDARV